MKAIVTGTGGTVAPVLVESLRAAGHDVVAWDRQRVSTDDQEAVAEFIRTAQPDWFFHLATGSPVWAEWIAGLCAELDIRFLYTSSVSVYASTQHGPFTVTDKPVPTDEYGLYKRDCEQRVLAANPAAQVARLGWQIGMGPGGNQMVDYLDRTFCEQGRIAASIHWIQACSFLDDTVAGLIEIMASQRAGIYHVDGNPGLSFYEIVQGLNELMGNAWVVVPDEAPRLNNRLLDSRIRVKPITERF